MGIENAIIVRGKTRLELLTEKFNTARQAKFYINQSKENFLQKQQTEAPPPAMSKKAVVQQQSALQFRRASKPVKPKAEKKVDAFGDYQKEHDAFYQSLDAIQRKLSKLLKVKIIDRSFLPNYIFSDSDIVVVVGRDGLVANTAKYVNDIPIVGINPDNKRYDGVLLPFTPEDFDLAILQVLEERYDYKEVTMAEAKLNDGQRLLAFNDLFIGPSTHVSARYKISYANRSESQSSSGIIVSTGAGSTGWLSSLFNMANGMAQAFTGAVPLTPQRLGWDESRLIFVVREPFISKYSKADLTAGILSAKNDLLLESFMPDNGVIFSDGIENDFLKFNSGAIANIGIAKEKARLVL